MHVPVASPQQSLLGGNTSNVTGAHITKGAAQHSLASGKKISTSSDSALRTKAKGAKADADQAFADLVAEHLSPESMTALPVVVTPSPAARVSAQPEPDRAATTTEEQTETKQVSDGMTPLPGRTDPDSSKSVAIPAGRSQSMIALAKIGVTQTTTAGFVPRDFPVESSPKVIDLPTAGVPVKQHPAAAKHAKAERQTVDARAEASVISSSAVPTEEPIDTISPGPAEAKPAVQIDAAAVQNEPSTVVTSKAVRTGEAPGDVEASGAALQTALRVPIHQQKIERAAILDGSDQEKAQSDFAIAGSEVKDDRSTTMEVPVAKAATGQAPVTPVWKPQPTVTATIAPQQSRPATIDRPETPNAPVNQVHVQRQQISRKEPLHPSASTRDAASAQLVSPQAAAQLSQAEPVPTPVPAQVIPAAENQSLEPEVDRNTRSDSQTTPAAAENEISPPSLHPTESTPELTVKSLTTKPTRGGDPKAQDDSLPAQDQPAASAPNDTESVIQAPVPVVAAPLPAALPQPQQLVAQQGTADRPASAQTGLSSAPRINTRGGNREAPLPSDPVVPVPTTRPVPGGAFAFDGNLVTPTQRTAGRLKTLDRVLDVKVREKDEKPEADDVKPASTNPNGTAPKPLTQNARVEPVHAAPAPAAAHVLKPDATSATEQRARTAEPASTQNAVVLPAQPEHVFAAPDAQRAPTAPAPSTGVWDSALLQDNGPATQPLRSFSLEFTPDGAREVRLHVSQHSANDVHVAVHSNDSSLGGRLRDGMHDLVGQLSQAGFEADAWNPQDGGGGRRQQPEQDAEPKRQTVSTLGGDNNFNNEIQTQIKEML